VALHRGHLAKAGQLLTQSVEAWKGTRHTRAEAYWFATQSAIWLREGNVEACMGALPRFMELYHVVRQHCGQDEVTARLVRVLDFTSQPDRADGVLHEYLSTYRRGRTLLSAELAKVCEQRGFVVPALS
jgi:hypothetical protein